MAARRLMPLKTCCSLAHEISEGAGLLGGRCAEYDIESR
jgi:hypothetical protein